MLLLLCYSTTCICNCSYKFTVQIKIINIKQNSTVLNNIICKLIKINQKKPHKYLLTAIQCNLSIKVQALEKLGK